MKTTSKVFNFLLFSNNRALYISLWRDRMMQSSSVLILAFLLWILPSNADSPKKAPGFKYKKSSYLNIVNLCLSLSKIFGFNFKIDKFSGLVIKMLSK